ncbi:MAG: OmpA family protein [Myxococcales bacterium]|nr:OmpA family protein [Myxococcales bacterium]
MSNTSHSSLRRSALGLLAAAAVSVAGASAEAQTAPYAFNRYEPAPAGETFFAAQHPWYSPGDGSFGIRGGIVADYAYRPLVARPDPGATVTNVLIEHMLLTHFQIGVGFLDRINIHLNVPLAVLQTGQASTPTSVGAFSGVAVGDMRLGGRVRIFGHADTTPASLHFGANFLFNSGLFGINNGDTSSHTNVSDNRFRGKFDLTFAGRASILRYSLSAGFHFRDVETSFRQGVSNAAGHEIFATAGLGIVLAQDRLTIGAEGWMASGVSNFFQYPWTNAEVIGGIHYLIADTILVGAGAGPGLTQGAGTPTVRGLFHVAYAPVRRPAAPVPTDRDGDGVIDPDDQCVDVPQGDHPDPARRGCPLGDRDRDGVLDPEDQCVDVPQGDHPDPARRGCPLNDTDRDGVFDNEDQCVNEPQGEHPDPNRRGCPDGDADSDGVLNAQDQCRDVPAGAHPDPARAGCPLPDRDGDTVVDPQDHCPDQPGAPHPDPNRNGCPGLVRVSGCQIQINSPVFFATNRDTILPRSFPVLQAVGDALRATPDIRRVSIEGHTDDVGNDDRNMDLSNRRAASVQRWMVEHQVEAGRLEFHGFGETRPLRPVTGLRGRAQRDARAQNRRVDFRIVDPACREGQGAAGSTPSTTPAP